MAKLLSFLVILSLIAGTLSDDLYSYDGSCVPINQDSLYFCNSIEYNVFLAEGDTLYEAEQRAMTAYLTASLTIADACCILPYRDYICASLLPRCVVEDDRAYPLYPCENWLCQAQVSDGVGLTGCFNCESYPLADGDLCSCPHSNTTGNGGCLPYEVYDCLDSSASLMSPALGLVLVLLAKLLLWE